MFASFICEKCGTNLDEFKQYYNKVLCELCYMETRKRKNINQKRNKKTLDPITCDGCGEEQDTIIFMRNQRSLCGECMEKED